MTTETSTQVVKAKRELDDARAHGDPLRIDLAENALNDLLERLAIELRCNTCHA